MIKQIGDKMGKTQWEQGMLMRYDTMPPWWWDNSKRDQAYQNYLEDKSYNQVPKKLVRLSVGIEDSDDLINDLFQALK